MDVFLVVFFFFFLFHSNDFILCTALINPERLARAAANTCFSDFVLFFKNSAVTLNFKESYFVLCLTLERAWRVWRNTRVFIVAALALLRSAIVLQARELGRILQFARKENASFRKAKYVW